MAEVSWIPSVHQLPPGPAIASFIHPVYPPPRPSQIVQQQSLRGARRDVPRLPLHAVHSKLTRDDSARNGEEEHFNADASKEFIESILRDNEPQVVPPPPRPSPRVLAWKRNLLYSKMEWDALTASPRIPPSKLSTQRTFRKSEGKRKMGKTMAPSMFPNTDAQTISEIFEQQADAYVEAFRKPAAPSSTVPSSFPGYRLYRRIHGTWAYQPPDTRQEALNAWFVKRMKRPPPPLEKVHVAFGRVTQPSDAFRRKKKTGQTPEPVVELPKMTVAPRRESVRAETMLEA